MTGCHRDQHSRTHSFPTRRSSDLGGWQELDAMVDAAYAAFGRVDILVNNAGSSPVAPSSLETSEALYDKVMAVNLKGVFRTCAVVGTRMAAGEGGSIIKDRKSTRLNSSH